MSTQSGTPTESVDAPAEADIPDDSATKPWVARLSIVACIAVFLGLATQNQLESWETLSKFGCLPANSIWKGSYWGLVTCTFVHIALWHFAFNVYWLWVLGSRLERAIGSLAFLAFLIVAAFVSSSFQLALSGSTGTGASGVVYAIFGFMWPARKRYSSFNTVLNPKTTQMFVVWLVGCVAATYLKVWEVGNAAHISGLLFGAGAAAAFALRLKPRAVLAALSAFVALSIIPLFWCPWSVTWLRHKAYEAHAAERYEVALGWYQKVVQVDPGDAWAYQNRSLVYRALGNSEKAQTDLQKARDIDPSIEDGTVGR